MSSSTNPTPPSLDYAGATTLQPKRPPNGAQGLVVASLTCLFIVLLALLVCVLWFRAIPEGWDRLGPGLAILFIWTYAGPTVFGVGAWLGLRAVWRGNRWGWLVAGANVMCFIAIFIIPNLVGR